MVVNRPNDSLEGAPRPQEWIALERCGPLFLISNTPKGRAIVAGRPIAAGTVIDTCPVVVLSARESAEHVARTALHHYTYNWPVAVGGAGAAGRPSKTQAVILGLGSMFNHSRRRQNVGWARDVERQLVVYRALRDIGPGEELCISYGDHLTFDDADGASSADEEEEGEGSGQAMLGRIEIGDE